MKTIIVTKIQCEKDTLCKSFASLREAQEWIEQDIKDMGKEFDEDYDGRLKPIFKLWNEQKRKFVYIEKEPVDCLEWEIHFVEVVPQVD